MAGRYKGSASAAGLLFASLVVGGVDAGAAAAGRAKSPHLFQTSDRCQACHNSLQTRDGTDVSIGTDWRASMMANSARDPYWHAAVRREVIDHPAAREAIEDKCSTCHMPMSRYTSHVAGGVGEVFAHLPVAAAATQQALMAADGVSCSVCHQIGPDGLGEERSFTGGFHIDTEAGWGERRIFGSFEVDPGRQTIMRSATEFVPTEAVHIQSSELCATCHTLYTHALGPNGETLGELPEQVPYLEWLHSDYRESQSCQSCHMPVVEEETPISSVLGESREGMSRHVFRGGNFFMLRMLARFAAELGVVAPPEELERSVERTLENLQTRAARLTLERVERVANRLEAELLVTNLGGHKLPTAYPSRRTWIHFSIRDRDGSVVFESGAIGADGSIEANDNDLDASRYEPHYREISRPDQVQIYEAIMADSSGAVTTGLLTAVRYAKDNRVLPKGFDKATASEDVAVRGEARDDPDFGGGSDRVRYGIEVGTHEGPFQVEVELWYQPVAFRWAHNLAQYDAAEIDRFVDYYETLSDSSAVILARVSRSIE